MCISDINILDEYPRNIPTQSGFFSNWRSSFREENKKI
jgi:hypothetical protein